ncbi:hypothetical protein [Pseudomonas simiae]|uniref:hypothetical protein n=1 Tax=Pseudomonas simiae TaxID=321846 RepID=UPI0005C42512|nr:hypothetical protein [Pseudomonas simiae]AJP52212.1 hypothetical protein PF1751_v1c25120 [Pseudomonas simiae]
MSIRWQCRLLWEEVRDGVICFARFFGNLVSKPGALGLLSLVAAAGSTVAAFYTWDAALTANKVSSASQAFAQKVYNDQIALGHPSVSVLSGETAVAEVRQISYLQTEEKRYAATVVLRNSGQRDSPRAWVVLSSDSFMTDLSDAVLVTLPKEIDISVRFNLRFSPRTGSEESSWYVAIVYEDEVPLQTDDPNGAPSSQKPLRVICSRPAVFKMSSWPKDLTQDLSVRMLSSGSPVASDQAVDEKAGVHLSASRIDVVKHRVSEKAHEAGACMDTAGT